jgi:hypothetical protein
MTHVCYPVWAHTSSTAEQGPYSWVETGVRPQFQSFSPSASVLRRIMLESPLHRYRGE